MVESQIRNEIQFSREVTCEGAERLIFENAVTAVQIFTGAMIYLFLV